MHPEWYQNLTTEPPMDKEWFERFAYGLPKIKDSAVIVTCRKEEFARKMVDAGEIYSPKSLEDEEAWLVFKRSFEEAMKKVYEKDKKKVKFELEKREKEIDKKLENDTQDIKKDIEEKSKELKEINDGMELIIAKERIEAGLKETKEVIRLKEEHLAEAEIKLEEARSDYENEMSLTLEQIEKEINAQNEHLDIVKDKSEDVQKAILKVKKEQINAKKMKFEGIKNDVKEIKKAITDMKKEKESREKELAEKADAIISKKIDQEGLEKKKSAVDEEIKKKKNIVNKAEEDAGKKKKEIEVELEELEKREKGLKKTTDKIIEDLKLEKMKRQIRDKCLGLPVALIEAAKGLAFEEYNKIYHPDS